MKIFILFTCIMSLGGIYEFSMPAIDGGTLYLRDFKGKKILLVNIATNSPYASQLTNLERLYQRHKDSLAIIAVPSNSFTREPLNNQAIKELLRKQFQAHYFVTAKSVVSGATRLPLYQWLGSAKQNGVADCPVNGDYQKFLFNKNGQLVGIFSPGVDPMSEEIQQAIQNN